jgi:hypothetical protein
MLVSTNAVEKYANFSMTTSYSKGARVVCPQTYKIYESIVNSNLGNQPCWSWGVGLYPVYSAGTTYDADDKVEHDTKLWRAKVSGALGIPVSGSEWELVVTDYSEQKWQEVGPSNKYAMFDSQTSTQTESGSPLTVVLDTGMINSLALVGLKGTKVTVVAASNGTEMFRQIVELDAAVITDWYQYYFEESAQVTEVVMEGVPPYSVTRVTVTLEGSGNVLLGGILFGTLYTIGDTEYGATAGITDYSVKETDEFGTTTFVKRDFAKRMSARMMLDNVQLRKVQNVLSELRATPCVWVGTDDDTYSPLVVYGFYREFSLEISYPTKSYCSLDIEGLT